MVVEKFTIIIYILSFLLAAKCDKGVGRTSSAINEWDRKYQEISFTVREGKDGGRL